MYSKKKQNYREIEAPIPENKGFGAKNYWEKVKSFENWENYKTSLI